MEENAKSEKKNIAKLGFHYYPDTLHYSERDLAKWLIELEELGAAWLVIQSPSDRAIPENFIRGLIRASIEPVIQILLPLPNPPEANELNTVLEAYSHWGVRYIQLFDRPNLSTSWSSSAWFQEDLVERFLDRYLPLAEAVLEAGMHPVFPPSEPGGNYWDTAFLRSALESMLRRKQTALLEKLVISAYGYTFSKPLDWGAGGPESWPSVRPYFTPEGSEDQRGFRIADWYAAICRTVLGKDLEIFLYGMGLQFNPAEEQGESFSPEVFASFAREIAVSLTTDSNANEIHTGESNLPVNPSVKGASFWLLAADPESKLFQYSWFPEEGNPLPVVGAIKAWAAENGTPVVKASPHIVEGGTRHLNHYLLLPTYEWGVADWHLDVIRPFVKKYQPTIGFSLEEASLAQEVTVIGNTQVFTESDLDLLRNSGCRVERISGDGTSIATQLAER
jgi:hypothetical protein